MDSNKIPLIIGVTGHLNLRAEDLAGLMREAETIIEGWKAS